MNAIRDWQGDYGGKEAPLSKCKLFPLSCIIGTESGKPYWMIQSKDLKEGSVYRSRFSYVYTKIEMSLSCNRDNGCGVNGISPQCLFRSILQAAIWGYKRSMGLIVSLPFSIPDLYQPCFVTD